MKTKSTDLVVIGAGPGGYAAAFYAADLGQSVVLVDKGPELGGVCLNRGCIPSKALLHVASLLRETSDANTMGIQFGRPDINLDKLRSWKNGILKKLSDGVEGLAKKRGVTVIKGRGYFEDSSTVRIESEKGQQFISFKKAILAVGSRPALPAAFDLGNKRIMTSTEALELQDIPKSLLIVGGGYIGMELGTVYAALGTEVVLMEATQHLLLGADPDLARPVEAYAKSAFKAVKRNTKVLKMATKGKTIMVDSEQNGKKVSEAYDKVLVAIGRSPNSVDIGLENTQVTLDDRGFVQVNNQQQTQDPNIYAIGDIAGGLLLAHKASKEARIAVEVITGQPSQMDNVIIPAVVFTDPEVAWCGLTETEAKQQNRPVKVAKFPWGASGRALTLNRPDGLTKLVIDPETDRVLGVGIVGVGAGDLISEGALAVESGLTAKDLAETVHPHPTLSETVMEAAEVFYGHSAHAYTPKR